MATRPIRPIPQKRLLILRRSQIIRPPAIVFLPGVRGANSVATDTSVTTISATIPTSTLTNDIGLAYVDYIATTQDCPTPAGWTLLDTQLPGTSSARVYKKIMATSEAGTSLTFTNTTAQRLACGVIVLDGTLYSDVDVFTGSKETVNQQTHASPASPALTVDGIEIVIFTERSSTTSQSITSPASTFLQSYAFGVGSGGTGGAIAIDVTPVTAGNTVGGGSWVENVANTNCAMWTVAIAAVSTSTNLVVQDATQAQTADSPTLTQVHELAVASAAQAQSADNTALTQVHVLAVDAAGQAQTAEAPTLVVTSALTVQDAAQAQTSTTASLTQLHQLTVDAALHAQAADSPSLVQQHQLAAGDAAQSHTADQVTLSTAAVLTVQDATQAQAAGNTLLTQLHQLAVDAALQAITSTTATLTQLHQLVVAGAIQAQTADTVTVAEVAPFTPLTDPVVSLHPNLAVVQLTGNSAAATVHPNYAEATTL